jgi:hypothetical protein
MALTLQPVQIDLPVGPTRDIPEVFYFPCCEADGTFSFLLNNEMLEFVTLYQNDDIYSQFSHLYVPETGIELTAEAQRAALFKEANPNQFDAEGFAHRVCARGKVASVFRAGLTSSLQGLLRILVKKKIEKAQSSVNEITGQFSLSDLDLHASFSGRFQSLNPDYSDLASETLVLIARKTCSIIKNTPQYLSNLDHKCLMDPNFGPPASLAQWAMPAEISDYRFLVEVGQYFSYVPARNLFNDWLNYVDPSYVNVMELAEFVNKLAFYIGCPPM